jgi:ankyrin repeat protein
MTPRFRRRVYGSIVLLLVVTATAAAGLADRRQITELLLKAGKGDVAAVKVMLDAAIPVDSHQPEAGETALMVAASAGHVQLVHFLLTAGAAVNARNVQRETALLQATMKGHVDVVRALLAAKADPDRTNPRLGGGRTPLMWALSVGNSEMASVLLDGGARVGLSTSYGATPLRYAIWHDTPEQRALIRRLLAAGADVDAGTPPRLTGSAPIRNAEGTALGVVAGRGSRGSVQMVEVLLAGGANVDARQTGGRTPLMLAAATGNIAVVRVLLDARADVNAEDSEGKSALQLAQAGGHADVTELLGAAIAAARNR